MQGTTPTAPAGPRLKLDTEAFFKHLDPRDYPGLYRLSIDLAAVREAYTVAELQAMGLTILAL